MSSAQESRDTRKILSGYTSTERSPITCLTYQLRKWPGHIPDYEPCRVGRRFKDRQELYATGMHGHHQHVIVSDDAGAVSIVLNDKDGGDVDNGDKMFVG
jgi:hypothetical protein